VNNFFANRLSGSVGRARAIKADRLNSQPVISKTSITVLAALSSFVFGVDGSVQGNGLLVDLIFLTMQQKIIWNRGSSAA